METKTMTDKVKRKRVTFNVRAEPGSTVTVAGDFNGWDTASKPLKEKQPGLFSGMMYLQPGSYQYKFLINGTWCVDPECREWVQNDLGTLNSVLKVK